MNGVMFGNKHSYRDFGLILSSKVINLPKVQTNRIIVPFRDGSIDLMSAVSDTPKYEDRTIQITFTFMDSVNKWSAKISEIENYLHGHRMKIIFDDDAAFYYEGNVEVNEWRSSKNIGTLVIECIASPYKYDICSSADDWEWDFFDFENGIINETKDVKVNGATKVNLICRKKSIITFDASDAMVLIYDNKSFDLRKGKQKIYDLFLNEGENELVFRGYGTVTVDYIGGSL